MICIDIETLAHIGTICGSIAAIYGIWSAKTSFEEYLRKRQYEAAETALIILRTTIDYVEEIISKPKIYQSSGYYPHSIPESQSEEPDSSWARPNRLVYNEMGSMIRQLKECAITTKRIEEFIGIISKLKKAQTELMGYLQAHSGKFDSSIASQFKTADEYKTELEKIFEDMKVILMPILNK